MTMSQGLEINPVLLKQLGTLSVPNYLKLQKALDTRSDKIPNAISSNDSRKSFILYH